MQSKRGFTLLEILIALMIFAIIGVVAAISFHSILRTNKKLNAAEDRLSQLEMTMVLLRRDFSEVINRSIIDADGNRQAALMTGENGVVFTRTGVINPLQMAQRTNMQRVGYALNNGNLYRLTWLQLNPPPRTVPEKQLLLKHVQSIQWQFLLENGRTASTWPVNISSQGQPLSLALPKAVLMVMHVKGFGVIQGVFPVPAEGVKGGVNAAS